MGSTRDLYLRSSFFGRTTQRANSPMKAPAAAIASISSVLRNRYAISMPPGCYMAFTRMLKVCYVRNCCTRCIHGQFRPIHTPQGADEAEPLGGSSSLLSINREFLGCRGGRSRRNFLGMITHRANSPTNAPAAAMASIKDTPSL